MTERRYFVYLHRREDTGGVFYVGKGTTKKGRYERAYECSNRSRYWEHTVLKYGAAVEIAAVFDTEIEAHQHERALIAHYGRKNLVNLTGGGEGCCGIVPGPETRRKLSVSASRPRTVAWVRAIRIARKNGGNGGVVKLGDKLPASWRANIAAQKIGNLNPMFGKTGAAHPMSRPVVHLHAGVFYDSVDEAANAFGYKMKTLYNWLSGHRPNPTALRFA